MFRKTAVGAVFALVLMLTVMPGLVGAQPAEHEGRLVLYASHPTEMIDFFVKRFEEEYGVQVDLVYGGTGELLARIRAEANRPQADILWGGGAHTGASAPDLFVPYDSPALDGISEEFLDPMGYNAPFDAFTMVIVYNKDLVSPEEAPRRWSDLTDPKWRGKVIHANPAVSSSAYAAMNMWLKIGGWELVEALARNQIIAESSSAPFTQVGQGEMPIGVAYEEGAFRWVPTGRIEIVYPEDGVAFLPGGLFIVRNGPNPNAARLFVDFLLSKEQQEALAENFPGRRPTHKEVSLHPSMPTVDQLNVFPYPEEEAAENREQYLAIWRQIMIRTR